MELPDRVALEAAWAEGNAASGPHGLIRQPAMRLFWRRCFGAAEEVPWDAFWTRFPKDLERLCDAWSRLLLINAPLLTSTCHNVTNMHVMRKQSVSLSQTSLMHIMSACEAGRL